MVRIILITLIIAMNSCTSQKKADLVVTNAKVYLVDGDFSVKESFAVKDGIIIATGTTEYISSCFSSDNVIDLEGKYIYPGFNDAHCHFYGYGLNLIQYADLRGTKSPEEIYSRLQEHYDNYKGKWILGHSWDQNEWENSAFPDKKRLDELFPGTPVYLIRVDGHAGWANSKALEVAGIVADTHVLGGSIVLDNGELSGILIDNAMQLIDKVIPAPEPELQRNALLEAQMNCLAAGLTSVTDCGVDKPILMLMKEMQGAGELNIRINAMLNPTEENIEAFVKEGPSGDERLVINTIKLYTDGALGSRGALLLDDYSDQTGTRGFQTNSRDFIDSICRLALNHDFIVATHAIGDGGNRLVLDIYEKYLKGRNDRRWRIEHAQIIAPEDFKRFASLSVIPSIQATHCTSDMGWVEERLGKERLKGAYAYQTLLQQNGWLPNGTDFPVEDINPLYTFHASVFRTGHNNEPNGGWYPKEALTREQALRSMTIWPAKASREEQVKGSIEPGKIADFVVLDIDLMTAQPEEIIGAKIRSTWIAGTKVFDAGE